MKILSNIIFLLLYASCELVKPSLAMLLSLKTVIHDCKILISRNCSWVLKSKLCMCVRADCVSSTHQRWPSMWLWFVSFDALLATTVRHRTDRARNLSLSVSSSTNHQLPTLIIDEHEKKEAHHACKYDWSKLILMTSKCNENGTCTLDYIDIYSIQRSWGEINLIVL